MRSNILARAMLLVGLASLSLLIGLPYRGQESSHHGEQHEDHTGDQHSDQHGDQHGDQHSDQHGDQHGDQQGDQHSEQHGDQHSDHHGAHGGEQTEDLGEAQDVMLPPPFRQLLVQEMGELEGAMMETQAYLVRGDLEAVAEAATRIRDSLVLHQELSAEQLRELVSLLPPSFLHLDREFHGAAGRLAEAARAGRPGTAAEIYAAMTQACVQCHGRFAAWRFPNLRPSGGPAWSPRPSGTEASLRGLHAVSKEVAWATGTDGTVLRTTDGGHHWALLPVSGAAALDFRDVEAFDADTALFLTAGQPARIYRTEDGGMSFTLVHESPHPEAFFDAMDFWDGQRGLVYSDPVDGRFLVLRTEDGGRSWEEITGLPKPVEGEAGFAASGTNVAVGLGGKAWIGTGGKVARVLLTNDGGKTWDVASSPLRQGEPSTGIFSIAFRDAQHGLVVGGGYLEPENPQENIARSSDGGHTWEAIAGTPPAGHRAVVAWIPGKESTRWLALGRTGTDISHDDGQSWQPLSREGFYTVSVAEDGAVWAAGSEGRIAQLIWDTGEAMWNTEETDD